MHIRSVQHKLSFYESALITNACTSCHPKLFTFATSTAMSRIENVPFAIWIENEKVLDSLCQGHCAVLVGK